MACDNVCKQFGPKSGPTKCRAWYESNLTLRWYSWKNFSKKLIFKNISRWQKVLKITQKAKIFFISDIRSDQLVHRSKKRNVRRTEQQAAKIINGDSTQNAEKINFGHTEQQSGKMSLDQTLHQSHVSDKLHLSGDLYSQKYGLPIEFEISETNKGKTSLICDSYMFRIDSVLKSNDISWRCNNRSCKARLRTDNAMSAIISINMAHNHDVEEKKVERHLLRTLIKKSGMDKAQL